MKTKIISINNQRMSSLEIAALTGKPHNDVMKAIRKMEPAWVKIAQGKFSLGSYRDPNNQLRPCYELTQTECLYIATKFKAHSGSPVIQEIILSNRIGAISVELAKRLNVDPVQALQLFYESKTCEDLRDKSSGLLPK